MFTNTLKITDFLEPGTNSARFLSEPHLSPGLGAIAMEGSWISHTVSRTVLAILLAVGYVLPVHAVLLRTTFNGTVTFDNGGVNPFGLSDGDIVSGEATWDDDDVAGTSGSESIAVDGRPGWTFTMTLGSFSFGQSDVTDPTFTDFFFNFGVFDGIEFFIEPIAIGPFSNLLIEDFNGGRSLFVEDATTGTPVYLELDWDFASAVTTPVAPPVPSPEPGILALLGLGLVGMGMAKR